ncbi:MAG: hypothetical protein GX576_11750 [Thauera phenolivorans]|uniref:Uncharacterized protein n=1 Tax=Thauera phenolivorans TaxID=1792543 RepID=A0A7X7R8R6_9RHOO|nr:hypothetical protein [Thauera phenolivorans]NLF55047.1 hypothetical protein [Thauera phenolivorans]
MTFLRHTCRLRAERGQVLALGLFFLFACAAVMYLMFNSGRAVDEKIRLTNAADAVAYSVALMETRALNYDAWTNRAIVANQVAIAQAVGLAAWLRYFERGVANAPLLASLSTSWIYEPSDYPDLLRLVAAFGGTAYANALGGQPIARALPALERSLATIVAAHDGAAHALAGSQTLLHASLATGAAQQALASELVRRIDPAMSAELIPSSHGFASFTRRYGRNEAGGDLRGRLAELTTRSLDEFSRDRRWSIGGPDIFPLQRNVELKRRGGTELIGFDQWRALDTLEHEGQRLRKGRWRWQRQSLAWSAAETGSSEGGRGDHGGSYRDNPKTSKGYAEPSMRELDRVGASFTGLPATRGLADLAAGSETSTGLSLRVSKPRRALRLSGGSSRVEPSGRLHQFDATVPGDEFAALARAEAFFDRSNARTDGRTELPSLYAPYWQVRLASPSAADRAWAAARQEGAVLP